MTTPSSLDWSELARVVADGVEIAAGDTVSVFLTDYETYPVVHAFCREVYRRGAVPHVLLTDERLDRVALQAASVETLAVAPAIELASMSHAAVHVSFRGMVPPEEGFDVDPDRIAAQRTAKGIVSSARWAQTRWALVRVPTVAWARYIGADPDTLLNEFIDGCTLDWSSERLKWTELADRLDRTRTVRILSADTDLTLPVAGRRTAVFAGEANWPDGEVATAPLEYDVTGFITFPERFTFASTVFENLRLTFDKGVVVDVQAEKGADVARALIATDSGSARVGELGIGLNPKMRTWTGDLLLDEKILGSVHVALGRAYPQCGGVNESSLHWDIVKDLRSSSGAGKGRLLFDEEIIIEGDQLLV